MYSFNAHIFTFKKEYETIIFDQEIKDEYFSNNMALNILEILLHKFDGHKKIIDYNKNIKEEISSPSEEGEGESGKYLELFFEKYNRELINSLIIFIKDKKIFFEGATLFPGEKFDILQKYVTLKNKVEENNNKINNNLKA